MGSWVEVNDEEAALAAAARFASLGDRLNESSSVPPEPVWGDDEFGARMKAQYPSDIAGEVIAAKQEIGAELGRSGTGVRWAVSAVTGQDQQEAGVFTNLTPPDV